MSEAKQQQLATLAVHAGQSPDPTTGSRAVPIYQTTSYLFQDADHAGRLFALKEFGNIYTRIMNPTTDVFEKRVAALEGGAAGLATASGQAAETLALTTLAAAGDEIVSTTSLYGGTYNLFHYTLPRLGITVKFVDADDFDGLRAAINDKTRAVYTETLGNPKLDVVDIEKLAAIAHEHKLPLVIDNTSASPALVRPIEWGADIVVNSATKFLGGHGTTIGGVIVDAGKFDWAASGRFKDFTEPDPSYHGLSYTEAFGPLAFILKARVQGLRDTGAALSPFNAFLLLQGIETLHLRLERHSAERAGRGQASGAASRRGVGQLSGPGIQPVLTSGRRSICPPARARWSPLASRADYEAGKKLIDALELFSLVANIGDAKSLVIHPASTTHQQLSVEEQATTGVTPELVRLSVGIEDIRDILADLDQAIEAANGHALAGATETAEPCCTMSIMTEPTRRDRSRRPTEAGILAAHLRRRLCARRAPVAGVRPHAGRRLTLHYAVYGRLNAARDNAVLVCHALSGSALVGSWWPEIFAPGGGSVAGSRFCDLHQHAGLLLRLDRARFGGPGDGRHLRPGFSAGFDPRQCAGAGQAAGLAGHSPAAAGAGRLDRRHAGPGVGDP